MTRTDMKKASSKQPWFLLVLLFWGGISCSIAKAVQPLSDVAQQVAAEIQWAHVPAGEFLMGSTSDEAQAAYEAAKLRSSMLEKHNFETEVPEHTVYLDAFEMSRCEITNAQYRAFIEDTQRVRPRGYQGEDTWADETVNADDQPVVGVTWFDAQAFAEWIGASLPSEAQWERAARGPENRKYPWGDNPPTPRHANFARRYDRTTSVGQLSKGATPEGICDLGGNVWEWCLDQFSPTFYQRSPRENPVNLRRRDVLADRVIRGGAWDTGRIFLVTSLRFRFYPLNSTHNIGFRVVRPIPAHAETNITQ